MGFKKNSSPRVSVTENEIYEICARVIAESRRASPSPFNHLANETRRHFKLLTALQKPKASWFHNWTSELFLFAAVSTLALTGKIAIEQYFGGK
jgi:hypothetical protein